MPVCFPPEICSPMPTPTRLVVGSGLVEAEKAEKEPSCLDGKSLCEADCLAALSELTCLSERPVKMIDELVEIELFADFLLDFLVVIKCSLMFWARTVLCGATPDLKEVELLAWFYLLVRAWTPRRRRTESKNMFTEQTFLSFYSAILTTLEPTRRVAGLQ